MISINPYAQSHVVYTFGIEIERAVSSSF